MVKKIFTYAVPACVLLFASVFYACHKDGASTSILDPDAPMSIALAEHYFYNDLMKQPGSFYAPKTPGGKANWKYVLFKKGYASQTPAATFVEIPLLYNQRPSVLVISSAPFSGAAQQGNGTKIAESSAPGGGTVTTPMASTADVDHLNGTFDRLVIFKDKLTQKVDQSIVTYIPDQDYLARHNNDVSHNQITRLDSDFSGYIQYRNWDDKIQFILQIKNGKSVKVLKYNSSGVSATAAPRSVTAGSAPRQTDAIVCTIQTIYHYEQMCYYTVTEEGTTESCGDWQYAGSDTYTDCYDDGSGNPATGNPCIDYGYCTTPVPPSTPPPAPTSVSDITSNLTTPCLLQVFNSLQTKGMATDITNLLFYTFGTSDMVNYSLSETTSPTDPNADAYTRPTVKGTGADRVVDVTTVLNDNLLNTASQEFVAETMMHEIIHGYLFATTNYRDELQQHILMITGFVDSEVQTLNAIFPNLSTHDAECLVLGGFEQVNEFSPDCMNSMLAHYNLTLNDVSATNNSYSKGNTGTHCP